MENCTICLSDINDEEQLQIECGHTFHKQCILNWFRSRNSSGNCPLCNDNPHSRSNQGNRINTFYSYNNLHVLYNQRYNLIKKKLMKDEEPKKTHINCIQRIEDYKKEEKELNKNIQDLKKDEYYKKIKNDIDKSYKRLWTVKRQSLKNKCKIISLYPIVFT